MLRGMQTYPWHRDRSAAMATPLAGYELYTASAPDVIARLGATTLGDLSRISQDELLAATRAAGCSHDETSEIFGMLGEYLAREGLSFRREPPITVIERLERPVRTRPRPGLVERSADGYRCLLPEQPPRVEQRSSPDRWTWEMRGYLLAFQVLPLEHADIETLAPIQHEGTIEVGPWGARLECERTARYAAQAGPAYEVVLFDAKMGRQAIASVQSWSEAMRRTTIPDDLTELTATLAGSLVPR